MTILTAITTRLLSLPILLTLPLWAAAPGEQGTADAKAAEIAATVLEAMGGAENYDDTRYISFRFFGKRFHVWDKHTGNIRVEDGKGGLVLMNVRTQTGKAWQEGQAVTETEALQKKLKFGYEAWINDTYWVVMPYKLRDPGVTLTYSREDSMENGRAAHVLTMTFEKVGVTPENKYEIFVDKESNLVEQWSFFSKAEDETPSFTNPWSDWKTYGKIKLSENRGRGKHTDLAVHDSLPESVFTSTDPVVFPQ